MPKEKKEVIDYSKDDYETIHQKQQTQQKSVKCLVIHPIFYPNKGPEIELYLAEEAIGLTKSLGWGVVRGPFWKQEYSQQIQDSLDQKKQEIQNLKEQEQMREKALIAGLSVEEYKALYEQQQEQQQNNNDNEDQDEWKTLGSQEINDGDYVYSPAFKGVYENGGMVIDFTTSDDSDGGDMFNEWNNQLVRQSIAKSNLMKVRKINSKNYFTRGKIYELGQFIKNNDVDALFINSELTTLQNRNLEKHLISIINDNVDDKFFKKSIQHYGHSSDSELSDSQANPEHHEQFKQNHKKQLKVFDRYTMILQIFAKRAKTQIAKLQIEHTFLQYLRTKLMREGGNTFSYMYNIFQGDLMQAEQIKLEVVSARQKMSGTVSGEGETQLELERRLISEKQAQVSKKLKQLLENQEFIRLKKKNQVNPIPKIALIGYTNAGKSALMNKIVKKEAVSSKDLLFQTLSTTSRKIRLISGQQAILLDTIGFITNLPHDLVSSFKTTLQEVEDADIVLHIRDISHPQTEEQKKTVLKVLKQLNFDQSFYTKKMIEVWNKIDLIRDEVDYDNAKVQDYPIIPISAKYHTNLDKLLQVVESKVNQIKNKKYYTFKHGVDVHGDRIAWLYKNANVSQLEQEQYNYNEITDEFPYGYVEFQVLLDEISYRRYLTTFQLQEIDEWKPKNTGMPPKNW